MKRAVWSQRSLFETESLVSKSIKRLQEHEPLEGYCLAFSGGKDSIVLLDVAKRAGVKFDTHYNVTTVDPPELVRFIKTFPEVHFSHPKYSMWKLILKKQFPPTRIIRFCCDWLKERGGPGRTVLTGIRLEESTNRANRKPFEQSDKDKTTYFLHPLIDWSSEDIWNYILSNNLPYCSLYNEGFHRLGCIMCPLQNTKGMLRDARRWPSYYRMYLHTFNKLVKQKHEAGKRCEQKDGREMMAWWLQITDQQLKEFEESINMGEKWGEKDADAQSGSYRPTT